jgi:polysaccharide export outer membrane protein
MRLKIFPAFFIFLMVFSFPALAAGDNTYGYTDQFIKMLSEPGAKGDGAVKPYLLRMRDRVRISVFGVEELSGTFQVDDNGMITIPLLGVVRATGVSTNALQVSITNRLVDGDYFNDPKVTIKIVTLRPFYILGEVDEPGSYEYKPDLDVFKAVAIAGDYTPRTVEDDVVIIRTVNGKKVEIKATERTPVLPGDSRKVKQRFF